MEETKCYIGCKIIRGKPMDKHTFLKTIKNNLNLDEENQHGYLVIYPDGYKSWSPKEVFENAYRLITKNEILLIID